MPNGSPASSATHPYLRIDAFHGKVTAYPSITIIRNGCGVATGADKVYIGTDESLPVEPSHKLPLLTRKDLKNNRIEWTGKYVLNPFDGNCPRLVDLNDYPKLSAHLQAHREQVQSRHVAKKNPSAWFKTIDRIYPSLTAMPKLIIPDIQGEPQVAYNPGDYYPHHNLYYVTSQNSWRTSKSRLVDIKLKRYLE